MFSVPQLRLWSRMIHCGTYAVYENPPMITGSFPSNSLTEALTGAAEAVVIVFAPPVNSGQSYSASNSAMPTMFGIYIPWQVNNVWDIYPLASQQMFGI